MSAVAWQSGDRVGVQWSAGEDWQVRVLLDALEARWDVKIPTKHPILCYLVEYAAFLLNRFEVGRDGRTAFERLRGRPCRIPVACFGEKVFYKELGKRKGAVKYE